MVNVTERPRRTVPSLGEMVMREPAGAWVLARKSTSRSVTFVALRFTVTVPGMVGAFTDGRFSWMAVTGS